MSWCRGFGHSLLPVSVAISAFVHLWFTKAMLVEICCMYGQVMWECQSFQCSLLDLQGTHLCSNWAHGLPYTWKRITKQLLRTLSKTNGGRYSVAQVISRSSSCREHRRDGGRGGSLCQQGGCRLQTPHQPTQDIRGSRSGNGWTKKLLQNIL